MIVAGCDVGSLTSKAVIFRDNKIIANAIVKSRINPSLSAEKVMNQALSMAGINLTDIEYVISTGYGRDRIDFSNEAMSEIKCHAKGASWLIPTVKTVIDIGGQDCKAIRIDKNGEVIKFTANDKCASGTGRFLEVMAKVLGIQLDEMGKISSKSISPITLSATCTVWSQADVIKHLNSGVPIEDIAAGINNAMANRVSILANSVKLEPDVCMTGGVAKNSGVLNSLSQLLGIKIKKIRKADPQLAGAIGAALFAKEKKEGE